MVMRNRLTLYGSQIFIVESDFILKTQSARSKKGSSSFDVRGGNGNLKEQSSSTKIYYEFQEQLI